MDKYFVLLGENPLLWGQVCHLRELGYKVILVAWNETPRINGDMYIQKDIKDAEGIIAEMEARGLKDHVYGALSSIDLAAPTVNAINGWCGNKTMPEKFNKVLSKEEMRDAWMKAGVFNRISKMDNEFPLEEIYETSQKMKLICKPNVAASSRGITILEKGQTKEALAEALAKAKETSFDGRCLIEEFVEGEEFTVDMLGDAYGNVNCYSSSIQHHSLYALKNHVTVIHHWNSRKYDDETWVRIANFGIECYKALGLHSMFGHLEIIMKEDGSFTPVEMGARSSGFICSHTVWKASGHDYLGDYVRMLHGEAIEPGNYMNGENASMWFGYDIPSHSHSVAETNITEFLDPRITVLYENHDGLKVDTDYGDYINDGDRDKFGYAILCGPRDIMTYESVQESNERFLDKFLGRKKMKNILYRNIVVDAGDELVPAIRIHPFKNEYLLTSDGDFQSAKSYLDSRFGSYCIFKKGRAALYAALSSYNLNRDDIVTILTTSDNFYISKCVTKEVDKICQWNREVTDKTKVIIFNHEFGFPCRDMKEVAGYGLPIIEDCAHTFYDKDPVIGKYSDFVVYSLPKAFPMQMGGLLKMNKQLEVSSDPEVENYVLNNLSRHMDKINGYIEKRRYNYRYLTEQLACIGIQPFFSDDKAIPGTYLFKWDKRIDYPKLKEFMYLNGVECSVFYGKNAFFIPVHQEVKQMELDYMVNLLKYYYKYGNEV